MMILVIGWHTPSDVIRRPAGVCCGSCLFVVVLFVSSLVFVSSSCFSSASFVHVLGSSLPTPCTTCACSFLLQCPLWCSRLVCSLILTFLRSSTSYRWPLHPLAFVQNTIYTHNLSMYGLFQTPWFTHCFGLNSSPGLRKHHALCKSASSY